MRASPGSSAYTRTLARTMFWLTVAELRPQAFDELADRPLRSMVAYLDRQRNTLAEPAADGPQKLEPETSPESNPRVAPAGNDTVDPPPNCLPFYVFDSSPSVELRATCRAWLERWNLEVSWIQVEILNRQLQYWCGCPEACEKRLVAGPLDMVPPNARNAGVVGSGRMHMSGRSILRTNAVGLSSKGNPDALMRGWLKSVIESEKRVGAAALSQWFLGAVPVPSHVVFRVVAGDTEWFASAWFALWGEGRTAARTRMKKAFASRNNGQIPKLVDKALTKYFERAARIFGEAIETRRFNKKHFEELVRQTVPEQPGVKGTKQEEALRPPRPLETVVDRSKKVRELADFLPIPLP